MLSSSFERRVGAGEASQRRVGHTDDPVAVRIAFVGSLCVVVLIRGDVALLVAADLFLKRIHTLSIVSKFSSTASIGVSYIHSCNELCASHTGCVPAENVSIVVGVRHTR